MLRSALALASAWVVESADELVYPAVLAAWQVVSRAGITVNTGELALKFSFGRATDVLEPGFHPLIPGLQGARVVPVRTRTLDLDQQRCSSADGLVWDVDANLRYRVVDLRRALIEVHDLKRAMRDALAISVQQVVQAVDAKDLLAGAALDEALKRHLHTQAAAWGVEVEGAGLRTISPTAASSRVTQLREAVQVRRRAYEALRAQGRSERAALGLIGTRVRLRSRALARRRTLELAGRRWRHLQEVARASGLPHHELVAWRDARDVRG